MASFYYINKEITKSISKYKSFMLDSGAFSFMNGTKSDHVNWDQYIETYAEFINEHNVKLFFELDIDSVVGIKEVERLRKKLERLTGRQCIPVWHKSRGKDYWLRLVQEYNYVAIGGLVTKEIKRSEHKFFHWFIDQAHRNDCKVHALGYTRLKGLDEYDFDSVDSTTWLSGRRFGDIYKFNGLEMKLISGSNNGKRVTGGESVDVHNFMEWVKFSQYAERYL